MADWGSYGSKKAKTSKTYDASNPTADSDAYKKKRAKEQRSRSNLSNKWKFYGTVPKKGQ